MSSILSTLSPIIQFKKSADINYLDIYRTPTPQTEQLPKTLEELITAPVYDFLNNKQNVFSFCFIQLSKHFYCGTSLNLQLLYINYTKSEVQKAIVSDESQEIQLNIINDR
jgi:hypothetical protein